MRYYDEAQGAEIGKYADDAAAAIDAGDYVRAFRIWDEMINGDQTGGRAPYFVNVTGFTDYFNVLSPSYPVRRRCQLHPILKASSGFIKV